MTVPTKRTIDNLGPDASLRYIEDTKQADLGLVRDSRIAKRAETVVTKSFFSEELDTLLHFMRKNVPLALFCPPPFLRKFLSVLFSYNLTRIGRIDIDKITEKFKLVVKPDKKRKAKEQEKLLTFLKKHEELQRILEYIIAKRGEYHKG